MSQATPIFVAGKVVGKVVGAIFKKKLDSRKHFLRQPPAIAFSVETIEQAKRAGADRVAVEDENQKWYVAFFATLEKKGFIVERDFGKQIALPLQHFRPTAIEAQQLVSDLNPKPKPEPMKQEELFA